MSKKTLHGQTNSAAAKQKTPIENNSLEHKRRRMLIKGTVAVPVILTLHSGAALARSSNLVSAVESTEAATVEVMEGQPQVICVKGAEDLGANVYDLGDPPQAMAELETYIESDTAEESIRLQGENCVAGNGIMVSANAWTSIGPKIGAGL